MSPPITLQVIVGTAGHIDHGKTALVKALTGVDADRLPEEKSRGITIDLGFAEMSVGDIHFGFVDVPGHEKFVKNMLAGASGLDIVLLVVAADEGVMPQTREHFEICRLLGIRHGIIVLTKTDLVDEETLELAKMDVAELVDRSFLEDAALVCVSARTGDGIDDLKTTLAGLASRIERPESGTVARLPIDRSFSIKGFGAVVTGTLISDCIAEGSELELMPVGTRVRVRGLQSHGAGVSLVAAGQRVAVNLGGIDHSAISRGMTLTEAGVLSPTQVIDVRVEVLGDAASRIRSRQRVRLHIGTAEVLARVHVLDASGEIAPGAANFAQLRLETPIVTVPDERFILRRYSPQSTIAGGEVIDPAAAKHRRKDLSATRERLHKLLDARSELPGTLMIIISTAGHAGITFDRLRARTGTRAEILIKELDDLVLAGGIVREADTFFTVKEVLGASDALIKYVDEFHRREPLAKGMPRQQIRDQIFAHMPAEVFQASVRYLTERGLIVAENDLIRLASHRTELSPVEIKIRDMIVSAFGKAGLEVPKIDDLLALISSEIGSDPQQVRKVMQLVIDSGQIRKVTADFYFLGDTIDGLVSKVRREAKQTGDKLIDVARFKEIAGVSRKYAIPLLEYFDREHITARAGDKRVIL